VNPNGKVSAKFKLLIKPFNETISEDTANLRPPDVSVELTLKQFADVLKVPCVVDPKLNVLVPTDPLYELLMRPKPLQLKFVAFPISTTVAELPDKVNVPVPKSNLRTFALELEKTEAPYVKPFKSNIPLVSVNCLSVYNVLINCHVLPALSTIIGKRISAPFPFIVLVPLLPPNVVDNAVVFVYEGPDTGKVIFPKIVLAAAPIIFVLFVKSISLIFPLIVTVSVDVLIVNAFACAADPNLILNVDASVNVPKTKDLFDPPPVAEQNIFGVPV